MGAFLTKRGQRVHIGQPMNKMLNQDGLINAVSGMGGEQDKQYYSEYQLVEPDWDQLTAAYRTSWIARKIIDIPVRDATREWRAWQAETADIGLIEAEEKRLKLKQKVVQAKIAARLYGGALLYMAAGAGKEDTPLNPETVGQGGLRYVTVLPPHAVTLGAVVTDPRDEWYGHPRYYSLSYTTEGNNNLQIHPSRMVRFDGVRRPDRLAVSGSVQGWEDSALTAVLDEVKRLDMVHSNVASLIFEAKIDIMKIPNLMELVDDPLFETKVFDRLRAAKLGKSNHNALVMDSEEEYEQKTLNFTNLPELMTSFQGAVAGAADIPATRLFGKAPDGMNATGEGDQRNYYDMVAGVQQDMGVCMELLDNCLVRSALGEYPDEVYYEWTPLWQPSANEVASIAKSLTESLTKIKALGIYSTEALEKITTTALTETGAFPGIESAVDEFPMTDEEMDLEEMGVVAGMQEPDVDDQGDEE